MLRCLAAQKIFVQQQTVRLVGNGLRNARAEAEQGLDAGEAIDPHPKIDHDQVGIARQVNRPPLNSSRHRTMVDRVQFCPGILQNIENKGRNCKIFGISYMRLTG